MVECHPRMDGLPRQTVVAAPAALLPGTTAGVVRAVERRQAWAERKTQAFPRADTPPPARRISRPASLQGAARTGSVEMREKVAVKPSAREDRVDRRGERTAP